jgi:hypothetical protein
MQTVLLDPEQGTPQWFGEMEHRSDVVLADLHVYLKANAEQIRRACSFRAVHQKQLLADIADSLGVSK